MGTSARAQRLGGTERRRTGARDRARTLTDRWPYRSRRPPLPHGGGGILEQLGGRRQSDGTLRMASRKTGTTKRAAAKKGSKKATAKAAARRRAATPPDAAEEELSPMPAGSTSLVIVESPAKAKTIGKYLGRGYRV